MPASFIAEPGSEEVAVAKPEWGTKRLCQSCGAKFYDFSRSPILCPSCGATFDPDALLRARRGKASPTKAKPPKAENVDEVDEAEDELADIEGDDELLESADELGDDDDVPDVAVDDDSEKEN